MQQRLQKHKQQCFIIKVKHFFEQCTCHLAGNTNFMLVVAGVTTPKPADLPCKGLGKARVLHDTQGQRSEQAAQEPGHCCLS